MKNILHITCSPQGLDAASYALSASVAGELLRRHPQAQVLERRLWEHPVPHADGAYAAALGGHATAETDSSRLSDRLIAELEQADCLLIGTPMHNYTVPSALKAWLDHVVRAHRTFRITPQGKVGTLADRPVYLALTAGGVRVGPHARQPDFLEPYLKAILAVIGLADVTVFSMDGLARGGDALAEARQLAGEQIRRHFGQAGSLAA